MRRLRPQGVKMKLLRAKDAVKTDCKRGSAVGQRPETKEEVVK